jgi:hypothetical protein
VRSALLLTVGQPDPITGMVMNISELKVHIQVSRPHARAVLASVPRFECVPSRTRCNGSGGRLPSAKQHPIAGHASHLESMRVVFCC